MFQAFEKIRSDPTFSVEGCHYELARDDRRHQQLAAFVRDHFMPDEPMNRSIGTPWNSEIEGFFISEVHVYSKTCLKQPLQKQQQMTQWKMGAQ